MKTPGNPYSKAEPEGTTAGEQRPNAQTAPAPETPPETETVGRRDPVIEMLNRAMTDSVARAGLLNCGFLIKNKQSSAIEWATEPAQIVVAIKLADKYGLDLMQRHLLPLEGKVYTTRDAMVYIAQKSRELNGIEQEDEAELTNGIGVRVTVDPMEDPALAEALLVEDRLPKSLEWRVWVVVQRKGAGRYRFRGRYPFWRKRHEWEGKYPNGVRVFKGWEPHPHGPEMAVKCAEAAALRRGFNIALPTVDEASGFREQAGALDLGGDSVAALQEAAGAPAAGVDGLAAALKPDAPAPCPDDLEADPGASEGHAPEGDREPGAEG